MSNIISNLIARLTLESGGFERGAAAGRKSLRDLVGEGNRASASFVALTRSALAVAGVAVSFEAVRRGLKSCIDAAKEAEKTQRFFEVALGDSAEAAGAWVNQYASSLGLGQEETKKFIGSFDMLVESLGAAPAEALKISETMTRLTNDMASFYRLKPEEAFSKVLYAMEGSYKGLRDLGIVMDEAKVKQYALNEGWITEGQELSDLQKLYAGINVLMRESERSHGHLARSAGRVADEERRLKQEWQKLRQEFGDNLMPVYQEGLEDLHKTLQQHKDDLRDIVSGITAAGNAVLKAGLDVAHAGSAAGTAARNWTSWGSEGNVNAWASQLGTLESRGLTPAVTPPAQAENRSWRYLHRPQSNVGPYGPLVPGEYDIFDYQPSREIPPGARNTESYGPILTREEYERLPNPGGATDTDKRTRELNRFNDSFEEELRNLRFEQTLLGKTDAERERAILLHNLENQAIRAGTTLGDYRQQQLERELDILQRQQRAAEINQVLAHDGVDTMKSFTAAIMEGRSATDALRASVLRLIEDLQEEVLWKPARQNFAAWLNSSNNGQGNWWQSIFNYGGSEYGGGDYGGGQSYGALDTSQGSNYQAMSDFYGYHGGGRVGSNYTFRGLAPAHLWDTAPRLHEGLAPDEFRAILRRGETVRTAQQEARLPMAGGGRSEALLAVLVDEIRQLRAQRMVIMDRRSGVTRDEVPAIIVDDLDHGGPLSSRLGA